MEEKIRLMTKQELILNFLYEKSEKVNVAEIVNDTGLKKFQIHNALKHLKNRGVISKKRIVFMDEYNHPRVNIFVEILKTSYCKKRIRDILEKARNSQIKYTEKMKKKQNNE